MKNLLTVGLFMFSTSLFAQESDLSLWETGGMYYCMPYQKGTIEVDYNYWYEDDASGMSLYGSYALNDKVTLKLELPGDFSTSVFSGGKLTALYGCTYSDQSLSIDLNAEFYKGEDWLDGFIFSGVNIGVRNGTLAVLGRLSGGAERYTESALVDISPIFEAEIAPFIYTGTIGMIGAPLMAEYRSNEFSLNIALDMELYLPKSISLWVVPRYEIIGSSGFSVWTGIAWMQFKE